MSSSILRRFFRPDFATIMEEYSSELTDIFKECDVIVFVARRSMSLYDALVATGYVDPQGSACKVVSSRAMSFANCDLSHRRVAVVDDVMITGCSMLHNCKLALRQDNHCIGLVAAQSVGDVCNVTAGLGVGTKVLRTLEKTDAFELTREINDFVQGAGVLNNIDQPEFDLALGDSQDLRDVLEGHSWFDCTTSIQAEMDYLSATITYDVDKVPFDLPTEAEMPNATLAKVRIISKIGSGKARMLPFVVLPTLTATQLSDAYDDLMPLDREADIAQANPCCDCDTELTKNKLRIVQYLLSWYLGNMVVKSLYGVDATVLTHREPMLFGSAVGAASLISKLKVDSCKPAELSVRGSKVADYTSFMQHVRADLLKEHMPLPEGEDDNVFTTIDALRREVANGSWPWECSTEDISSISSVCLDYMIDCGILVPYIRKEGEAYIRAYRSGEIEQLSKRQMTVFALVVVACIEALRRKSLPCSTVNRLGVLFSREVHVADQTGVGEKNNLLDFSYSEEIGLQRKHDYREHSGQLLATILAAEKTLGLAKGKVQRLVLTGKKAEPGFTLSPNERRLRDATSKHFLDYLKCANTDSTRDKLLDTLILYGSRRYVLGRTGTASARVCEKISKLIDLSAAVSGKKYQPLEAAASELVSACQWATKKEPSDGKQTLAQEFIEVSGLLKKKYQELELINNTRDQYAFPGDAQSIDELIFAIGQFGEAASALVGKVQKDDEKTWLPVARRLLGRGDVLGAQIRTILGTRPTLAGQFSICSQQIGVITYTLKSDAVHRTDGQYKIYHSSDNRVSEFTLDRLVSNPPYESCGIIAIAFDLDADSPYDVKWRGEQRASAPSGVAEVMECIYPAQIRSAVRTFVSTYADVGVRRVAIVREANRKRLDDADYERLFPCGVGMKMQTEKHLEVTEGVREAFGACGAAVCARSFSIVGSDAL